MTHVQPMMIRPTGEGPGLGNTGSEPATAYAQSIDDGGGAVFHVIFEDGSFGTVLVDDVEFITFVALPACSLEV